MQPSGEGESLTVFLENSDSAKDIWALTDSWSDEPLWSEGRVEIKATELSEDTKYRVRYSFQWVFIHFETWKAGYY